MSFIKIIADLPEALEKIKEHDLALYEKKHGVKVNYRQFSLILTEQKNACLPLGILTAYTAYSEIYIDDLWVHRQYRKKGYGTQLLTYLEQHFTDKGFHNINLVTSAFQAPDFYSKCGYELEFIRKNITNPQLSKYFFVKYFSNKTQTQGIA